MSESDQPVRMARFAMGTRFEAVLEGSDAMPLRIAGEAALEEIDLLHAALNLFRPDSYLSFLNRSAHERPVRVDLDLFELITRCKEVHDATEGAFDPTVAPLMRCWGFHQGTPARPEEGMLSEVRRAVGLDRVILDPSARTVRFLEPGMALDFGAVAKGFALDRAAEILRDDEVLGEDPRFSALIHGGTSTVIALGREGARGGAWKVGVKDPVRDDRLVRVARLADRALSVSAPHGRAFEEGGEVLGHVLDPATGAPSKGATLAAVIARDACGADAWSTAFLAAGPARFDRLLARAPGEMTALLVTDGEGGREIRVDGKEPDLFAMPGPSG